MSKAIKHIRAGLLHIEVIGTVPERPLGPRGRASRSRPTSAAQQFYNDKCSWKELELILAASFWKRALVLIYTYDDEHLPADKNAGDKSFQKHIRKLRAARRMRGDELRYVYNTEGFHEKRSNGPLEEDGELEDRRIHHHGVINSTSGGDPQPVAWWRIHPGGALGRTLLSGAG